MHLVVVCDTLGKVGPGALHQHRLELQDAVATNRSAAVEQFYDVPVGCHGSAV
jgi:ribosomal protein S5